MEEKQKKQPAKRIQLVNVVLERKGSQVFSGRLVRSPEDAVNIILDFHFEGGNSYGRETKEHTCKEDSASRFGAGKKGITDV